jgi:hypothetical protein
MCVVSMVMDDFGQDWQKRYPPEPLIPLQEPTPYQMEIEGLRQQFKEQVEILERLIKRAKQYDIDNNEPDCEIEDKKKTLQDIADKFGVKINFE